MQAVMNDENSAPTIRITRARSKSLGLSSGLPPLHTSAKQDDKQLLRAGSKRTAPDSKPGSSSAAVPQLKKRAVLKDVTNVNYENKSCITAAKGPPNRKRKVQPAPSSKNIKVLTNTRQSTTNKTTKVGVKQSESISSEKELLQEPTESVHELTLATADRALTKTDDDKLLKDEGIIDIDREHNNPLMCSMYAADIYFSFYGKQFDMRPSADYMERLQKDITESMRSILVCWLVEVSEEYRLVPDTLYLTVNLIDRYLSQNYIEKQRLQLLGVTCMLIASKYEEICPPRVEEFCFITDNTYTKEEVVKMESRVLNFLNFKISVPTAKKFLRRFIQAAHASYKVPSAELEFLANYLAELTLTDYSFLKFVPSLTAASAVFLARWILDQSQHPWNPTLKHYTKYDTWSLRSAVLELQELQVNASGSMLNAIREKYKQPKFKGVSTLDSPEIVESLFKE